MNSEFINILRMKLADDKNREVLNELLCSKDVIDDTIKQGLITLSARLKRIENDRRGDVISGDEFSRQKNQINFSLLDIIAELDDSIKNSDKEESKNDNNKYYHLTLGGTVHKINSFLINNFTFIGLDFGTSTTTISYIGKDGDSNLLPIPISVEFFLPSRGKQYSSLIPSVLFYDSSRMELTFGFEAKSRKYEEKTKEGINYWSSFKMKLGRNLGNEFTNSELKNNEIVTILNPKDATREFFKIIKRKVDDFVVRNNLPREIHFCVSIPASFEANQRRELIESLEFVGIINHQYLLIDEPNAAFLNYLVKEEEILISNNERQHVLVFDFGAGTCDVSIFEFGKKNSGFYSKNIAISKFEELGGDDVDRKIAREIIFPDFCEEHELDKDKITELEYEEIFEPKFKAPAEALKIKISEQIKNKNLLNKKSLQKETLGLMIDEVIIINYKNNEYIYEDPSITAGSFKSIMNSFVDDDEINDESIFFIINSALSKAKMEYADIDYVLLIGGSCKNPLIQEAIRNKFLNSNIIIPSDLQNQVSKGASINSLLANGLNLPPIAPIVSETISLQIENNKFVSLISQGDAIPYFKSLPDTLCVQRNGQKSIEIPIFVSGKVKMLENIIIFSDKETFQKDDKIRLTVEIDHNKIIIIKVFLNGKELKTENLSPFANEALTPFRKFVKEIIKNINDLEAEGKDLKNKDLKNHVETLIEALALNNDFEKAMEYSIKYFPNNHTDIAYFASNSGNNKIAKEYTKKAFDENPSATTAYNLAMEYTYKSVEFIRYLSVAAQLGSVGAKIELAKILFDEDEEQGIQMMTEAFDYLYALYKKSKIRLAAEEYDDLITVLEFLNYYDILEEVEDSYEVMLENKEKSNRLFNEENLLKINYEI